MTRTVRSPSLSRQLGFLLRQGAVLADRCVRAHLPSTYDVRELVVLALLHERSPLSQQRIADIAHINRTVMVKLAGELESRALVSRARDSVDRRRYALAPTASGEAALTSLWPLLEAADERFTAQLKRADQGRLTALVQQLLPERPDDGINTLASLAGYHVYRAHIRLRDHAVGLMRSLHLEPRHFAALTVLADDQPCSQQHLAAQLGVSPPAIRPLVDDLLGEGLVRRVRNRIDRRAYDLTVTATGMERLTLSWAVVDEVNQQIRERLGADQLDELRRLLTQLLGR